MRSPISVRQAQLSLSEVLQFVTKHKDMSNRIKALRENDTASMRRFCVLAFGPNPYADIVNGGYKPQYLCRLENVGVSTESFHRVVQALSRAADPAVSYRSRCDTLNDLLDWLNPKEVDIVISVIDGQVAIPGFTEVLVRSAFPELL